MRILRLATAVTLLLPVIVTAIFFRWLIDEPAARLAMAASPTLVILAFLVAPAPKVNDSPRWNLSPMATIAVCRVGGAIFTAILVFCAMQFAGKDPVLLTLTVAMAAAAALPLLAPRRYLIDA